MNLMGESMIRKQQMEQRTQQILHTALNLFCEKGIEDTSVDEIAKAAGVGPATIYRYFETKAELAVSAGTVYWQMVAGKYTDVLSQKDYQEQSGLRQMEWIFHIYSEFFEKEFLFLKFIQEFDIFIQRYHISKEHLENYEEQILNLRPYMTNALEKGLRDGSLIFSYTVDEIYFSITHTLLSLMQKLACSGHILSSDERVGLALQVEITGGLLLKGLSSEVSKISPL